MTASSRFATIFSVLSVLTLVFALAAEVVEADVVTIRDPAFDLPHVCADTDAEAAREQGYQAARDRIAQFLLIMNTARGTLHGALGNLGVGSSGDIETRRTQYSRSEYATMFQKMSADEQAILLAYCEGVNKALNDMLAPLPLLDEPLEVKFFKQPAVANKDNLFGNKDILTQGQGFDPYYQGLGAPGYINGGFQFTPEIALSFAVLQIRNFGFEGWDEIGMAESLSKLMTTYGASTGTELWDDRYWMNDPLAPVSVPDSTTPGFGGPLAALAVEDRIEMAEALGEATDAALGRTRLPGYPMRDYAKALEKHRSGMKYREETAIKWGAWPKLGSYAWLVAPDRSATGNPWLGGFPQTGIQVPSIMHYTEIRGDTMQGNGMAFVGGPYVLIGHTDNVAFTTTTAHLKLIDSYIEELVSGDVNIFNYDNHGTIEAMAKRVELVQQPNGGPLEIPVFRTNVTAGNGGDRPVTAFSGDAAGTIESATSTSVTDTAATLTPAALVGGYVAIVDGTGAGQMRAITGNTADTITVGVAFATIPDSTSEYVAVEPGNKVTAVAFESVLWMGEGQAAGGFSLYQKTQDVLDVREAVRSIPSTHNFFAVDNSAWNGIGADHGTGNMYYATSGLKRVRQGALDPRLPIDGTAPNPFVVVGGTVSSAGPSSMTATGDFTSLTFSSAAVNFMYDNPGDNGEEYAVAIVAGNGNRQVRRIVSNTDDTLSLEHPWGSIPSAGDVYEVYEIWATPEAMNPAEGWTANWNNKQAKGNEIQLSQNGRNHRVEAIHEQLKDMTAVDRQQLRDLNKYVAGVVEPGNPGRYLLTRLGEAIAAEGDCGTVDNDLITQKGAPENGREFDNPLFVGPVGELIEATPSSGAPEYVKNWATDLAVEIYGDEYDPAAVSKLTRDRAIGWILHAIDDAAGDVAGSYSNVYTGDYFNGADWKQVVRDSFCDYVALNPTINPRTRSMQNYNHPLAALPCGVGQICATPIKFDPVPFGNRGTWEQIVEVSASGAKGEFVFPLGQSGHIDGSAAGFTASAVHQRRHTSTLQPLWRDWRFAPMLRVCEDVTLGGDEDGDTDGDGVLDAFEKYYYGDITNGGNSDTDGDGADLQTEQQWGSDPTLADTDEDGVPDGSDVAPQDRLCVSGTLKKVSVKDSATAGKDKVTAKWSVPLHVCIGGDYATACTVDADCGGVGRCNRVNLDPAKDEIRILTADNSPLLDATIPISKLLWKSKVTGSDHDANPVTPDQLKEKHSYADKLAVNGPVAKIKVQANDSKDTLKLQFQAKNFDMAVGPDDPSGVVGLMIGSRCFVETSANCKVSNGKLSCKE